MTESEKMEILSKVEKGETLPENLKIKLMDSIKSGEPSLFEATGDEYLCCAYQDTTGEIQYSWITYKECQAFGGRAADKSMCGQ